jgi:hypothetical protein
MTTMTADPRSSATMEAAERALFEAEAAETAASAAVEEARMAFALDPGKPKNSLLHLARRRLAECQETTANAAAAIKAIGRERERLNEVDRATRLADRRSAAAVLEAERVVLAEQAEAFFANAIGNAGAIEAAIADWNARATPVRGVGGVGLGHLDPPSTLRISWDRFNDGLQNLYAEYRRYRRSQ